MKLGLSEKMSEVVWHPAINVERPFVRHPNMQNSPGLIWHEKHKSADAPVVSIIIPAFDAFRDGYFPKLLGQISNQNFLQFEIVVVRSDPRQGRAINIGAALAEFIQQNRFSADNLGIKVIMITAESCSSDQRRLIEEMFGCKTANEYGCSETGGFVYECSHGSWHISSELTFIEFLDKNGNPVSPGDRGEIFLTDLRNDYMPLIRYRVGDMGSPLLGTCGCGRGLPIMEVSVAKESEFVRLANGESYSSEIFDYINLSVMKACPSSILQFRVTQKSVDLFEIEVVSGAESVDSAEELFKKLMKKQLGANIKVHFKRVPNIERDPSGKLRYFVSEVNRRNIR